MKKRINRNINLYVCLYLQNYFLKGFSKKLDCIIHIHIANLKEQYSFVLITLIFFLNNGRDHLSEITSRVNNALI